MPVLVPLSPTKQTFTTQLGDWRLGFYWYYNERSERWCFDCYDAASGLPLVLGQPFVLGTDFFDPYVFGIGSAIAFDSSGKGAEAGPDDLGVRVVMPYWTPDEAAIVREGGE